MVFFYKNNNLIDKIFICVNITLVEIYTLLKKREEFMENLEKKINIYTKIGKFLEWITLIVVAIAIIKPFILGFMNVPFVLWMLVPAEVIREQFNTNSLNLLIAFIWILVISIISYALYEEVSSEDKLLTKIDGIYWIFNLLLFIMIECLMILNKFSYEKIVIILKCNSLICLGFIVVNVFHNKIKYYLD